MGLRFLSVFLISFLLLSPLIRQNIESIEKPLILMGIDNSESILMNKDSLFYKNVLPEKLNSLIENLKKDYEVKVFAFGESVEPYSFANFNKKQTDIAGFLSEMENSYVNRNVGAMVLVSDGIYNKGLDPYYAASNLPFRIYCVPLGDTIQHRDVILRKVDFNPTVFLGDRFPLEIGYAAYFCKGMKTRLMVKQGKKTVFSKEIIPGSEEVNAQVKLYLDATEIGRQFIEISLDPVDEETSKANNSSRIVIQVLNSREKIALLYHAPHPDIAAFEKALSKSGRYEITTASLENFSALFEKFDLMIFHQLPSIQSDVKLDPFLNSGTPVLFILGTQSDLNAFNKLNQGLNINAVKTNVTEAQPVMNENFSLFTLEQNISAAFAAYPPLLSPLGAYQYNPISEILCFQKIGMVNTRIPQILFTVQNNRRTGIIAGENLWKWRLSEFIAHSNNDAFDGLINKIVQLLSVTEDKSFFRVKTKDPVMQNEAVFFEAELYNESYELINDPEVNLLITDSTKKTYPYIFNKTDQAYQLNLGIFPIGTYTYKAFVKHGQKQYEKSGSFTVMPVNHEAVNLLADHHLLSRIATSHNGETIPPAQLQKIKQLLDERDDIHSISNLQKKFTDLIGNPWLFAIILILLSAEWTIRKRSGL